MTHPAVLTAVVTVIGVIVTAVLTFVTATQSRTSKRLASLERDLGRAENVNRNLWAYTRALVNQIYKLGGDPQHPPTYIKHLYDDTVDSVEEFRNE